MIDKVGSQRRKTVVLAIGKTELDRNITTFEEAGLSKAPAPRGYQTS